MIRLTEKTGKGLDVNSIFTSNEYEPKSNDNSLYLKIPIDEAIRIFKQRGFDVKKQENSWDVSKGSILLSMYDVKGSEVFSPWGVEVVVSSETGEFIYGEIQTQRYIVSFNVDWNYTESELSNAIKNALNSLNIEFDSFNVTERKYESKKRGRKTEAFNQPYSDNIDDLSFEDFQIDGTDAYSLMVEGTDNLYSIADSIRGNEIGEDGYYDFYVMLDAIKGKIALTFEVQDEEAEDDKVWYEIPLEQHDKTAILWYVIEYLANEI